MENGLTKAFLDKFVKILGGAFEVKAQAKGPKNRFGGIKVGLRHKKKDRPGQNPPLGDNATGTKKPECGFPMDIPIDRKDGTGPVLF